MAHMHKKKTNERPPHTHTRRLIFFEAVSALSRGKTSSNRLGLGAWDSCGKSLRFLIKGKKKRCTNRRESNSHQQDRADRLTKMDAWHTYVLRRSWRSKQTKKSVRALEGGGVFRIFVRDPGYRTRTFMCRKGQHRKKRLKVPCALCIYVERLTHKRGNTSYTYEGCMESSGLSHTPCTAVHRPSQYMANNSVAERDRASRPNEKQGARRWCRATVGTSY